MNAYCAKSKLSSGWYHHDGRPQIELGPSRFTWGDRLDGKGIKGRYTFGF